MNQKKTTRQVSIALFLALLFVPLFLFSQSKVITVPYIPSDPTKPHLTYNNHPTILKAIARNMGCTNVYFRWDIDGNGTWDNCGSRTLIISSGNWYRDNEYDLSCKCNYPTISSGKKLFIARIEVACAVNGSGVPIGNSYFGSYPVQIDASIPSSPASATDNQLATIREVAIDDAMWYLHSQMVRSGTEGYLNQSTIQGVETTTSLALLAFAKHNRLPAYSTYNNYGITPPAGFTTTNTQRWNTDPYAEDASRLLNYMLKKLTTVTVTAADEADDGTTPISGTNNLKGLMVNNSNNYVISNKSLFLVALANINMQGTVAQAGGTGVIGKTIEYIAQEMVDYSAYCQQKSGTPSLDGGWGYTPTATVLYAQQSGGWYLALREAEANLSAYGLHVPNYIKMHIPNMLHQYQSASGASEFRTTSTHDILEATPLAAYGAEWLGWQNWSTSDNTSAGYPGNSLTRGQCRQIYDNYRSYLSSNWTASSSASNPWTPTLWKDGNYNSGSLPNTYYTSLMNVRFLVGANYSSFLGHNVFREFTINLANNQITGNNVIYNSNYGSFDYPSNYYNGTVLPTKTAFTSMALITLTMGPQVALPLELISFEAQRGIGHSVALDWQTYLEVQVSHFEVERSTDGRSFGKIGSIQANNLLEGALYQFEDTNAPTGEAYYRLKMVDMDQSIQYSPIEHVPAVTGAWHVQVYPNPVSDLLYLRLEVDHLDENLMLQFFDQTGKLQMEKRIALNGINSPISIDIQRFPAGNYILLIRSGTRQQAVKILKVN